MLIFPDDESEEKYTELLRELDRLLDEVESVRRLIRKAEEKAQD